MKLQKSQIYSPVTESRSGTAWGKGHLGTVWGRDVLYIHRAGGNMGHLLVEMHPSARFTW